MPQASASASSHLLSRRRVALAIPLLGSALVVLPRPRHPLPCCVHSGRWWGRPWTSWLRGPMPSSCAAPPSTPLHACVSWRRC